MSLRIGIGKNLRITPTGAYIDPAIPIINDGNTVGWYLADELSTITKDGANLVSRWNDFLGSGHDLIQAVGGNQPLWVSPDYIQFDGIDNFMKTATFVWNQPCFTYMIFNIVTWPNAKVYIDGFDATHRMAFWRNDATENSKYILHAGTTVSSGIDEIRATWHIVRVMFNGAASWVKANTTVGGNKNAGAQNASGLTVGSAFNGSAWSNIKVKEIICRKIVDAAPDEQTIYNYLVTRMP